LRTLHGSATEVLRVIDELDAVSVEAGITGGWAVNALLGRPTRAHGDVDLGVRSEEVAEAFHALARLGSRITIDQRPARVELRSSTGAVDLHPILWDESGRGIHAAFDEVVIEYPPGRLDANGLIEGRPVMCGTPELQLAFHTSAAPRLVDRHDMRLLAVEFGLDLPHGYGRSHLARLVEDVRLGGAFEALVDSGVELGSPRRPACRAVARTSARAWRSTQAKRSVRSMASS
jgi:lincosamide nucleotidyltransferase A/C/D/E